MVNGVVTSGIAGDVGGVVTNAAGAATPFVATVDPNAAAAINGYGAALGGAITTGMNENTMAGVTRGMTNAAGVT